MSGPRVDSPGARPTSSWEDITQHPSPLSSNDIPRTIRQPPSSAVEDLSMGPGALKFSAEAGGPQPNALNTSSTASQDGTSTAASPTQAGREYRQEPEPRPRKFVRADLPLDRHSVSLAVPYANTMPSTRPVSGDRPLQATTYSGPVAKHTRTMTPAHETANARSGRRTLNLLNPVHLLMRRRSQVPQVAQEDEAPTKFLTVPPMTLPKDYDPRIRGSVVHDFSAPRSKRASTQPIPREQSDGTDPQSSRALVTASQPVDARSQDPARSSVHSPVFREQFADDSADHNRTSAIHAEQLADHKFLQRISQHGPMAADPALATQHGMYGNLNDFQSFRRSIGDWQARMNEASTPAAKAQASALKRLEGDRRASEHSTASVNTSSHGRSSHAPSGEELARLSHASSGPAQQRTSSTTVQSDEADGSLHGPIPKHVKSNASRFSFQLAGHENAVEEHLLEERAKHTRGGSIPKEPAIQDEDEDYFDEDAMYDADEFDGLGEDDDLGLGLGHQQLSDTLSDTFGARNLGLGILNNATAPVNDHVQQSTAWQPEQTVAVDTPFMHYDGKSFAQPNAAHGYDERSEDSKRSDSHQGPQNHPRAPPTLTGKDYRKSRASHDFDDDFYFNDGTIFATVSDDEGSFMDDESALFGSEAEEKSGPHEHGDSGPKAELALPSITATEDETNKMSQPHQAAQDDEQSDAGRQAPPPSNQSASPGMDRLAAYHSALAEAAHKAAAEGRFSRTASSSTSASGSKHSQRSNGSQKRLGVGRSSDVSRNPSSHLQESGHRPKDSYSGFDFGFGAAATASTSSPASASFPVNAMTTEDAETNCAEVALDDYEGEDDDIISEANAEALASDEEGFYGREFGFYARARPGSADDEPVNGGFFGVPGESTIERKYSIKEPNLTPITERSEFSARNSVIGGPFSPASLSTNPAALAAQLARMSPIALAQLQEDYSDLDISLEQMLRLRNLAFNGSERGGRSGSISSMSSSAAGGAAGWGASSQRGSWASQAQILPSASRAAGGSRMSRSHSDSPDAAAVPGPVPTAAAAAGSRTYSPISAPAGGHAAAVDAMYAELLQASPVVDPEVTTPRKEARVGVETPDSPQAPATAVKINPRRDRAQSTNSSGGCGGADSVTYTKEMDDEGKERWVLERRRTGSAGLVEVIGREIVQGGAI